MEYGTREVRQVRAAQNQSLFREINEEVKALNDSFSTLLPIGEWVCECADLTCVERIEMTGAKYEAIRQGPNRFPVIPGHELPEVERVVQGATAISWSRRSAPEPPSQKTTTHANLTERRNGGARSRPALRDPRHRPARRGAAPRGSARTARLGRLDHQQPNVDGEIS